MKKSLLLAALALLAHCSYSQWQYGAGNTPAFYTGGNVGIGTSSPTSLLHVVGQTMGDVTNGPAFVSKSTLGVVIQQGNIGNDFVSSYSYLSIFAHNIHFDGTNWIRRNLYSNTWATVLNHNYYDVQFAVGDGTGSFNQAVTPTTYLRLLPNGNLLIGKTSQANSGYKLDVNGNVRANSVVINTTGADYVFDPGYRLMPLNHLGNYLRLNHHLPGIAPATEMQDQGMNVSETQTALLAKVEELTLYVLQQQKEIDQLKKAINAKAR
jgi:hypothetical protein